MIIALDLRHMAETGLGPPRTISHHQLGPDGWVFDLAVLLLAAGSLAIAVSLARRRLVPPLSVGMLALAAWSGGLAVVALFQKTDWSVGPSLSGTIHRIGSVVAFAGLPFAALLIGRYGRGVGARVVMWLGLGSLAWVAGIAAVMVHAAVEGRPWWRAMPLDVVERGLALTEIVTLLALGAYAASRRSAGVRVDRTDKPLGLGSI